MLPSSTSTSRNKYSIDCFVQKNIILKSILTFKSREKFSRRKSFITSQEFIYQCNALKDICIFHAAGWFQKSK